MNANSDPIASKNGELIFWIVQAVKLLFGVGVLMAVILYLLK